MLYVGCTRGSGPYGTGRNVSVTTNEFFESGAITIDGGYKGTVAIEQTPVTVSSGGIELQDLPSLAKPQDAEQVRQNVLTLMSARQLAGKKMTAHEIAQQLHISIEEAEIAVLSPIGDEIQIATPDLSRLSKNGSETSSIAIPLLGGAAVILSGGIILYFYVTNQGTIVKATDTAGRELWQKAGESAQDLANKYLPWFFPSTHDHGGGKNSQHGKSEDRPSDLARLEELQEQLKDATGKEKVKIQNKINNLKKAMAARRKGENHSQKPKK